MNPTKKQEEKQLSNPKTADYISDWEPGAKIRKPHEIGEILRSRADPSSHRLSLYPEEAESDDTLLRVFLGAL